MASNTHPNSRRAFLKRSGLAAASALVAGTLPATERPRLDATSAQFDNIVYLIRPEDQLSLTLSAPGQGGIAGQDFEVFRRLDGFYYIKPKPEAVAPMLRVTMAPQQVVEWAVTPLARPSDPIHTLPTELLFHVPPMLMIKLTVPGVLNALRYLEPVANPLAGNLSPVEPLEMVPAAQLLRAAMALDSDAYLRDARARGAAAFGRPVLSYPDWQPNGTVPLAASTRLLVSSRLIVTPPGGATRFFHAVQPVNHDTDLTEIWHTRLTVHTTDFDHWIQMPVPGRAIFALDGSGTGNWLSDVDDTKMSALSGTQAKAIVAQNAKVDLSDPEASALHLSRIGLSPRMGASARLHGRWSHQSNASVKSFSHTTGTGRDVHFRITQTGRLYPLGHRAVQVTTVDRVFKPVLGVPAGVLDRTFRINVIQTHRNYDSRTWPFTAVEILDDTPPPGQTHTLAPGAGYLKIDGLAHQYRCRGIDRAGRPVEFELPLVFVPDNFSAWGTLSSNYTGDITRVDFGHVTVAEPGQVPGATEVVGEATLSNPDTASFVPSVVQYRGRIPALGQLAEQDPTKVIQYSPRYALSGFDPGANEGQVVLQLGDPIGVGLTDSAAVGGLFSPVSMQIKAMSRSIGAVAGNVDEIADGDFRPESFFGTQMLNGLKLFGIFPLSQLIAGSAGLAQAPKLATAYADGMRTQSFRWEVPLFQQQSELVYEGARLRGMNPGSPMMTIESVLSVGDDGQPHQRTTCVVRDVLLAFGLPGGGELLRLPVPVIEFTSVDTRKPHIHVGLGEIEFDGVLAFVSRLAKLIDSTGFSGARAIGARVDSPGSGPSVDVTPEGVRASYSLSIPSVAVGAFSLENITFGAALSLPFSGVPRFDFNFATPDNPFRVIVSCLGGGGSLAIGLTADKGLETLQGALEFAAQLKIDLEVVSGKVSAAGGIFFKLENGDTTLTGYLKLHGEVSVLSIITLGLITTVSLTYLGNKVRGEAELVFYVSTFFFSTTVRRTFKRKFAGSNGDPTFAQLMAPENFPGPRPFDDYCKAFI